MELEIGSRALQFGPRPLPNVQLCSTVEVFQFLGLWREAGVEIQDFDSPGLGIYRQQDVRSVRISHLPDEARYAVMIGITSSPFKAGLERFS